MRRERTSFKLRERERRKEGERDERDLSEFKYDAITHGHGGDWRHKKKKKKKKQQQQQVEEETSSLLKE